VVFIFSKLAYKALTSACNEASSESGVSAGDSCRLARGVEREARLQKSAASATSNDVNVIIMCNQNGTALPPVEMLPCVQNVRKTGG